MENKKASPANIMALERTKLANERTFLAYLRTFIVFFSSGFAILKIEVLDNLTILAYLFIATAILLLVFGTVRFIHVRKRITRYLQ
ncbi:DUF202 domain-containing protein [Roseivirga sp. BDSF3-8]|uniref:DUF202 domain-containing protein n=1 Tax=Roseivirga sp. BDSF3-8 TaxID=3241598 RepID=UPI0035327C29